VKRTLSSKHRKSSQSIKISNSINGSLCTQNPVNIGKAEVTEPNSNKTKPNTLQVEMELVVNNLENEPENFTPVNPEPSETEKHDLESE
jgi:hypothetical protein